MSPPAVYTGPYGTKGANMGTEDHPLQVFWAIFVRPPPKTQIGIRPQNGQNDGILRNAETPTVTQDKMSFRKNEDHFVLFIFAVGEG